MPIFRWTFRSHAEKDVWFSKILKPKNALQAKSNLHVTLIFRDKNSETTTTTLTEERPIGFVLSKKDSRAE